MFVAEINLQITKRTFCPVYLPDLHNYSYRWGFFYGSAGSGKSVYISQKLIIKALSTKRRVLVVRKYATTIKQSVYQLFKDTLTQFKIIDKCRVLDSTYYIELPNGSEIIFMGADDEQKLLSIQDISDIFVEEATELDRDFLTQLSLRMRGKAPNPQIHLAFNPVSTTNFMYDFMEVNPPANHFRLKTTFRDNPFLPKEYVEALLDLYNTDPRKARVFCDGEWGVTGLLVFENWDVKEFDWQNMLKNNSSIQPRLSLDWGFSLDPTAFTATLYNKDAAEIYIFDELYRRGMTNPEIADWLKERHYHKQPIWCDSAEPKSITELNRLGIRAVGAKKGKDSIKFGISFLQRHKIIIHPACVNVIREFKDYQYKMDKQTGNYDMEKFVGADHAIDALRYAYSEIYKSSKVKTLNKTKYGIWG